MTTNKLFGLLVMGGALLVANTGRSELPASTESENAPREAMLAFCSVPDPSKPVEENTCVKDADGNNIPREGLVCCWGTSCDSQ